MLLSHGSVKGGSPHLLYDALWNILIHFHIHVQIYICIYNLIHIHLDTFTFTFTFTFKFIFTFTITITFTFILSSVVNFCFPVFLTLSSDVLFCVELNFPKHPSTPYIYVYIYYDLAS